jgi:uncharacterized Zn finger protein (UPF0148 family)
MRILDSTPVPGSTLYSVVCTCGRSFSTEGDHRGMVQCPDCKKRSDIRSMVQAWKATPDEKLARLRELAAEAKELHAKWVAIPELKRDEHEGRVLSEKLDACHAETKEIMATIEPKRVFAAPEVDTHLDVSVR